MPGFVLGKEGCSREFETVHSQKTKQVCFWECVKGIGAQKGAISGKKLTSEAENTHSDDWRQHIASRRNSMAYSKALRLMYMCKEGKESG